MALSEQMNRILDGRDSAVRLQDDFFCAVNGTWLKNATFPADQSRLGSFIVLRDEAEAHVRELLESGEASSAAAQKAVDFYRSWMDTDRLNAAGVEPIRGQLDAVQAVSTKNELAGLVGKLLREGVSTFFGVDVDSSFDDPDRNQASIYQSGIGLPDEAYYHKPEHAKVLEAYKQYVPDMLALALGFDTTEASRQADIIIGLETKFASFHTTLVDLRNPVKMNNPRTIAQLVEENPGFDWTGALAAAGFALDAADSVVVLTLEAARGGAQTWANTALEDLKIYTTWRILQAAGGFLTEAIDKRRFDFYGRVLEGTTEQRARWKRGVQLVNGALGEAVGELYVSKYFPPSAKAKMEQLVADLLEAYRRSILALDWMSEETKQQAIKKVDSFNPKIGYPDHWKDYSALSVGPDLLANVQATNRFEFQRSIDKLGKPVDRSEWLMNPQTVNAYYNPQWNEIVFPAAILQFPFFDPDRDAALNYGGIGAVIGHEIGHGFDDQGSQFDARGALNNWWTDTDRAEFEKRTAALAQQYDQFVPSQFEDAEDAPHVNGKLTLGENIGDLGGLSIALKAYAISLEREGKKLEDAPIIDGYTGTQRLFLSYARIWRSKARDEWMRQQIALDPHSPEEFRANGVVRNVDAFYEAFGVNAGDGLYLAPEERVHIW
ncbi:M13 family metallopeptidase [Neoactinobaculum massilliense]|uniref:M13 family metallopeptidase n=1 Tax=Neoactinobaculum massilliense TaxID=2364794 RepID=UPI000F542C08|nr:M13-type metalloendopeptidase [Neoactinobaculum massilliense]